MTALLIALAISATSFSDDANRFSMDCGLCLSPEILDLCEIGQGLTLKDEGIKKETLDTKFYYRSAYLRFGVWAIEFRVQELSLIHI